MANRTREHLDSLGYNPTMTGLGALLQGINSGMQQNKVNQINQGQLANQTQETAWKNPYRAPSDLDILKEQSDPVKMALARLLESSPLRKPQAPLTQQPSQSSQQQQNNASSTPAPVWANWTGEDFMGFKEEMKKRGFA